MKPMQFLQLVTLLKQRGSPTRGLCGKDQPKSKYTHTPLKTLAGLVPPIPLTWQGPEGR